MSDNDKQLKRTLWLARRIDYKKSHVDTDGNPVTIYNFEVLKAQNVTRPGPGDLIDEAAASGFISDGWTVNIG